MSKKRHPFHHHRHSYLSLSFLGFSTPFGVSKTAVAIAAAATGTVPTAVGGVMPITVIVSRVRRFTGRRSFREPLAVSGELPAIELVESKSGIGGDGLVRAAAADGGSDSLFPELADGSGKSGLERCARLSIFAEVDGSFIWSGVPASGTFSYYAQSTVLRFKFPFNPTSEPTPHEANKVKKYSSRVSIQGPCPNHSHPPLPERQRKIDSST